MEKTAAITALAALAHDTRIDIFRQLVQAGGTGLIAGELAERLDVKPNTLSNNLNALQHAGLITSKREGRMIRYFAQFDGMSALITFLLEDCCGGRPDMCAPFSQTCAPKDPK